MKRIYNRGYVVKGLFKNQYTSLLDDYRGIECFPSWPLDDFDDQISKELQDEAWDKWFSYQDILEVVPERNYLDRYVNHCKTLSIPTMILKIEIPIENPFSVDELDLIEVLGFDCIASVNTSYLNLQPTFFKEHFPEMYKGLNTNRLYDTLDATYAFLERYNQLLAAGKNLEYGASPTPARLSIVQL